MLKIQFAILLLASAMVSTDTIAMKRSADHCADEQMQEQNLISLPDELLLRIFSSHHPSDLIVVCKKLCAMFQCKNWQVIVHNIPGFITRYSLDCQRIYYYLMQKNNVEELQQFFAEDINYKRNLYSLHRLLDGLAVDQDFKKEFNKLSDPNKIIEFYRQRHMPYFSDTKTMSPEQEFVNNVLHNNLNEMKKFIQNTPDETLAKVLEFKKITLAHLGSLAMFEVVKPKLSLNIAYPDVDYEGEGPALDIITLNVTQQPNRSGRYDIIEFLLKLGADTNIDEEGSHIIPAIEKAHEKNDYTLLKLLFAHGLDVNPEEDGDRLTKEDYSAITWAIDKNNSRLVHTLLSMNANPHTGIKNARPYGERESYYSVDLLELAQEKGNQEIIDAIEIARIRWAQKDSANTDDNQS